MESAEEIISREVMKKLAIPQPVSEAIEGLRDGLLAIPVRFLRPDTLLLAKQLSPVPSPLQTTFIEMLTPSDSVIDLKTTTIPRKASWPSQPGTYCSMSAALLV